MIFRMFISLRVVLLLCLLFPFLNRPFLLMMRHLQDIPAPAVGLGPENEIDGGPAEKIQDAGVVKADG